MQKIAVRKRIPSNLNKLKQRNECIGTVYGESSVEPLGCCHLEVFVRILIGGHERVPLMTEHNREATQAKTEESHHLIFFSTLDAVCVSPACCHCVENITLTMPPLCRGPWWNRKLGPTQLPLPLPPEPCGQ